MTLEQTNLSQTPKVNSALETLRASRKFKTDKLAHGLSRVDLHVDGVEGDWLENWSDQTEQKHKNSQQGYAIRFYRTHSKFFRRSIRIKRNCRIQSDRG